MSKSNTPTNQFVAAADIAASNTHPLAIASALLVFGWRDDRIDYGLPQLYNRTVAVSAMIARSEWNKAYGRHHPKEDMVIDSLVSEVSHIFGVAAMIAEMAMDPKAADSDPKLASVRSVGLTLIDVAKTLGIPDTYEDYEFAAAEALVTVIQSIMLSTAIARCDITDLM